MNPKILDWPSNHSWNFSAKEYIFPRRYFPDRSSVFLPHPASLKSDWRPFKYTKRQTFQCPSSQWSQRSAFKRNANTNSCVLGSFPQNYWKQSPKLLAIPPLFAKLSLQSLTLSKEKFQIYSETPWPQHVMSFVSDFLKPPWHPDRQLYRQTPDGMDWRWVKLSQGYSVRLIKKGS